MMRLADDNVLVTIGDSTLVLRPSLRAASTLHRRYNGFQQLARDLADGHFSAVLDLIETCGTEHPTATVAEMLAARDQLIDFVLILAGAGEKTDQPQTGKAISFEEYHKRLFQIGTGWLGWTPHDTWNATPAEILAAREGRLEMLKAMFGAKEEQTVDAGSLDSMRDDLNAIGNLQVHSLSGAR
jgi:hypothetical protein